MSRRTKNANNSPYKTGDTDSRDFPETAGEVVLPEDYTALIDDVAAIMERVVALEAGGGGGAATESGALDFTGIAFYAEDSSTVVSFGATAAEARWTQVGGLVKVDFTIERSGDPLKYFEFPLSALVALGLPPADAGQNGAATMAPDDPLPYPPRVQFTGGAVLVQYFDDVNTGAMFITAVYRAAVPLGGAGGGGDDGNFTILDAGAFNISNTGGPVTPDVADFSCWWARSGKVVVAHFNLELNGSPDVNYLQVYLANLLAEGLPTPDPAVAPLVDILIDGSPAGIYPGRYFGGDGIVINMQADYQLDQAKIQIVYKAEESAATGDANQIVTEFAIPAAQIQVIGGSSSASRNGLCRWVKTGRHVTATIKAYIGGSGNTMVGIETVWLLAQGLPAPSTSTLSPASDFPRCVPATAQLRGPSFGWETPLSSYADFDDETYFRLVRASAGDISEIHAVLNYIAD